MWIIGEYFLEEKDIIVVWKRICVSFGEIFILVLEEQFLKEQDGDEKKDEYVNGDFKFVVLSGFCKVFVDGIYVIEMVFIS